MRERDWLVPSTALTLLSAGFALLLIPDYSGIMPALRLLPLWLFAAGLLFCIGSFAKLIRDGEAHPLGPVIAFFTRDWRVALFWAFCLTLSGMNMIAFMWTKPLLNYLVPFWADPLLADLDHALFLGHDPWTLLTWLNSTPAAIFYHKVWFILMIVTLLMVLAAPPSPEKSATMLTYFILWSVVGPVIHTLLPAAGPIFYAQMGYGDRFAALQGVSETHEVANYLWTIYSGERFGPGSGISAMPSLHIATTTWMVMAVALFARRWLVPMSIAATLILLLSIALGWHYFVDGLVGGGAALICYRMLRVYYAGRPGWSRQPAVAG